MISITLETLTTGKLRATGRIDGRTVQYFDGIAGTEKLIVMHAVHAAAGHLVSPSGDIDRRFVTLNKEAQLAIGLMA